MIVSLFGAIALVTVLLVFECSVQPPIKVIGGFMIAIFFIILSHVHKQYYKIYVEVLICQYC